MMFLGGSACKGLDLDQGALTLAALRCSSVHALVIMDDNVTGQLPPWFWSPSANFYYKLSTQFRGTGMPMDVFNGGANDNQARLDTDP
jgi:hypothetical protein